MTDTLRVTIAAPIDPSLCDLLVDLEPRIDLIVDLSLLAPRRYPADFAGDPAFRRTVAQQRRFDEMLRRGEALFGIPDLSPAALATTARRNPDLRWVHTMAAGGGGQVRAANLTPDELTRIVFTTSAGVHGRALAEFAALGVLAGAKSLPRLTEQKHQKRWTERWLMGQVANQRALILGFGGIGQAVASTLKALGMHVTVMARSSHEHGAVDRFVKPADLLAAANESDAVIQTLPGTDTTDNMLDTLFFSHIKDGATIVNVGRGTVIDEESLTAALQAGRVGFAALDVFTREPLPPESPLWTMPNVLISPHTAALTDQEERAIVELFSENATRLLDDQPLRNRVNTIEFY
ncbi:D-2-hydroxyacid dehydrogenase [Microbacterium sp. bgisy207]|uniref:D-2-hydroxyacid dehydrogenase n=1 Tax=Microbacterium sp. bgisy207 TaxID=3413800 RepID=UPI003EBDF628